MTTDGLKQLTQAIVADARRLNAAHTDEVDAPVNYACIFSHSLAEYEELVSAAQQLGERADDTATGPLFLIPGLATDAGLLQVLKVRKPDPNRRERGDADFTVSDYQSFKTKYLDRPGFGLIKRTQMEMIELIDPAFNVLAYYSHPTIAEVLNLPVNG
jgi:hypothetical protein